MAVYSFELQDAIDYGTDSAVLLKNIRFWLDKNLANEKHFHDGRVWTYNSTKAFTKLFPYLTQKQIEARLRKLEDAGILISGNYNASAYDRTKWYSVNESRYSTISRNEEMEITEKGNGFPENVEPIPDNKPDIKKKSLKEKTFKPDATNVIGTKMNLPVEERAKEFERAAKAVDMKGINGWGIPMRMDFVEYWTDVILQGKHKGKMLFEVKPTWNWQRRMKNWLKIDKKGKRPEQKL